MKFFTLISQKNMETLIEIEDYINEGAVYSTFTIKYIMNERDGIYFYTCLTIRKRWYLLTKYENIISKEDPIISKNEFNYSSSMPLEDIELLDKIHYDIYIMNKWKKFL